jgi:type II secretory pathway pseudopilin PulG
LNEKWYKTSGLEIALVVGVVAMVAIAVLGIILAIAIPYYVAYIRTACDRAAHADVLKLAAAFERLGNELADRNLRLDNEAIKRLVDGNAVQHMVGPYYRFQGCTSKCEVLIRINRHEDDWVIEGTALKGSRPEGSTSRYVYRAPVAKGRDLPATVAKDVLNAHNGKSLDWNSYPYASPGQPEICYTESIIHEEGPPGKRTFSTKLPKGVPCSKVD